MRSGGDAARRAVRPAGPGRPPHGLTRLFRSPAMPNSASPINGVAMALLMVFAVPLMVMGIVGLVHFDELWWLYGLLLTTGGLLAAGAVTGVVRWRRAL